MSLSRPVLPAPPRPPDYPTIGLAFLSIDEGGGASYPHFGSFFCPASVSRYEPLLRAAFRATHVNAGPTPAARGGQGVIALSLSEV